MRLNTGCLAAAATRPLISEKTMIPIVAKANTQIRAKPNCDPALAAKTSSLMSTKPPTAVMIPSVNSSGFKAVLDLLEPLAMRFELSRRRVVRLPQNGLDLRPVGGVRLRQRLRCALQLLAQ